MHTGHLSRYSTIIKAPVEKVWDALTNPDIVKQYFFGSDLKSTWEVGSPITFSGEYEGKTYADKGIVLEYIPNTRLSFSYLSDWAGLPDLAENYLQVTYEVSSVPEGTEMRITQSNYDADRASHSEENWAGVIEGLRKIVE